MATGPFLEQVDEQEQNKGDHEHDDRQCRRAFVVVLLQLGDECSIVLAISAPNPSRVRRLPKPPT